LTELKETRDPVAAAEKSEEAKFKALNKLKNKDSTDKVHRFDLILESLASISEVHLSLRVGSLIKSELRFSRRKEYTLLQPNFGFEIYTIQLFCWHGYCINH
jgi:hypothetical protein